MRYLTKILIVTVCLITLSGFAAACDCGTTDCAPKSPGYWKNHPEAWPVQTITIGNTCDGYKTYSVDEAIAIMQHPVKGDKVYTMFDALIAAKLNGVNCCQSYDVKNKISEGDLWMSKYYYDKDESPIRANSSPWQDRTEVGCGEIPSGEEIYLKLDAYNNGQYN